MKNKNFISIVLSILLSFVFVAVAVYAATTIGTNIDTGGTLAVTGLTTLGNATSSVLSVTGMTYLDGGLTMDTDKFTVADTSGNTSIGGTLTVTGNSVFSTASSTGLASLDSIKISSVGSTVAGVVFGTCTVDFGTSLDADIATTTNCSATGVTTSDKIFLTPSDLEPYIVFNSASSTATNVIQVQVFNATSTSVNITSHTWSWMAIR